MIYSLAALGLAPVAANAAVVSTGISFDDNKWTGATNSPNAGVIKVSVGGKITQKFGTLQPGNYEVQIKTIVLNNNTQLTVTVDGADQGGTGTIKLNSDKVAFKVTSAKEITVSIEGESGKGQYEVGNIQVQLDFDFAAVSNALNEKFVAMKNAIAQYACAPGDAFDTELANISAAIELIGKQETDADDDVYEAVYENFELFKGTDACVVSVGREATDEVDGFVGIDQVQTLAYEAEKAELTKQLNALKDRLAELPTYATAEATGKTSTQKGLDEQIAEQLAAFAEGQKSNDIQANLAKFKTAVENVEAKNAVVKAQLDVEIQPAIDEVGNMFKEVELERQALDNKYSALKNIMKAELDKDEAKLQEIAAAVKAAYEDGTLLSKWTASLESELNTLKKKFETISNNGTYRKTWMEMGEATTNSYLENLDYALGLYNEAQQMVATAKADNPNKEGAKDAEYTAVDKAFAELKAEFIEWSTAKWHKETYYDLVAKKNVTVYGSNDPHDTDANFGKDRNPWIIDIVYGEAPHGEMSSRLEAKLNGALTTAVKDLYGGADAMALAQAKTKAKAAFDAIVSDNDKTTEDYVQRLNELKEANPDWASKYNYDVTSFWNNSVEKDGKVAVAHNKKALEAAIAAAKKLIDAKTAASDLVDGSGNLTVFVTGLVDDCVAYGKVAIEKSGTDFTGNAKNAADKFIDYSKRVAAWEKKVAEVETMLQANYAKAYNDAKNVATEGTTFEMSYKDQIAKIKASIKVMKDGLAAAKAKHGDNHLNALAISESGIKDPEAPYNFGIPTDPTDADNLITLLNNFTLDTPVDVYGDPLLADNAYDEQALATATENLIKSVQKKVNEIKAAYAEFSALTNDDLGAAYDEIRAQLPGLVQTAWDDDNDTSTPKKAIQLANLVDGDVDGLLGNTQFNSLANTARNGDTAPLYEYSDYLDTQLAKVKELRSDIESAKAVVAANEEFYVTPTTLEINGANVKPCEIAGDADGDPSTPFVLATSPLYIYYTTVTALIEKNDFKKYPALKEDAQFGTAYNTRKAQIASWINSAADAVSSSYAAGTLQEAWEKNGMDGGKLAIRRFVAEVKNKIDRLQVMATEATAAWKAKEAIEDELVAQDLWNYDSGNLVDWPYEPGTLFNDVVTNVAVADPTMVGETSVYGKQIIAQYNNVYGEAVAANPESVDGLWTLVNKEYAAIQQFINGDDYPNAGGASTINTTDFNTRIEQVVTALNAIEPAATNNLKWYSQQSEYVKTDASVTPAKDVEAAYTEVYGKIDANDQTAKGKAYLDELKGSNIKGALATLKTNNSKDADWDQLKELYLKGQASEATANELKRIYDRIRQIEKDQAAGFDAAVSADNQAAKDGIQAAIDAANAEFNRAVAIQEDNQADSEILLAAVLAAADDAELNKAIYEYPAKIEAAKQKYLKEGGAVDKWIAENPGQVYDNEAAIAEVKGLGDAVKAAADKYKNTVIGEATTAINTEILAKTSTAIGYMSTAGSFHLKGLETGKGKSLETKINQEFGALANQRKALQDAVNDKNKTLKSLDDAVKAFLAISSVDEFNEGCEDAFNNVAFADLNPAYLYAEGEFNGGNAAYGEDSETATDTEKEQWAEDALLFDNDEKGKEGLKQIFQAAVNAEEFKDQIGKQYNAIVTAYNKFIPSNLYTKSNSSDAAKALAQTKANTLQANLDAKKAAAAAYNGNGNMQPEFNEIENEIAQNLEDALAADFTNKSTVENKAKTVQAKIDQLIPTKLATAQAEFCVEQLNELQEQYNLLEDAALLAEKAAAADGATDEQKAAATEARATANAAKKDVDKLIGDFNKIAGANAYQNGGEYAVQSEAGKTDKTNPTLAKVREDNAKLVESYETLGDQINAKMKELAEKNGVDAADVKADILAAADAAEALADAALDAFEDLTDAQKEALQQKLDNVKEDLEAIKAAAEASDNIIGDATNLNDQIDAAVEQIATIIGQANSQDEAAKDKAKANETAAESMLATIESLEKSLADAKDALADDDVFCHITPTMTASRVNEVVDDIAQLKQEVLDAQEAGEAVEYKNEKADPSDLSTIFEDNVNEIANDIVRVLDFASQKEMQAEAADLQAQLDEIEDNLNEGDFTAADYQTITGLIDAIQAAIYTEPQAATYFPSYSPAVAESGLAFDAKTVLYAGLTGLKKTAANIQDDIDDLKVTISDLSMVKPSEIAGDLDGDGIVSADDVEDFLDDLLNENVPTDASDPLFYIYDVNGDGVIDIADAQAIQNLSLGLNIDGSVPGLSAARGAEAPAGNITAETENLQNGMQRITLTLNGNFDWTGFQMNVQGAEVLAENAEGMSLRSANVNGKHRIVAFGATQSNGKVITLDVNGNAQLGTITFTTANAQAVSFKLGATTGIYGISTEKSGMFYDLSGKLVKGMKKGVNIIRDAAGKAKKAIMK